MQKEIIDYGTPTQTSDIRYWNSYRTQVVSTPRGLAYQVGGNGSLSQDFSIVGAISDFELLIGFDSSVKEMDAGTRIVFQFITEDQQKMQTHIFTLHELAVGTYHEVRWEDMVTGQEAFTLLRVTCQNTEVSPLLIYTLSCIGELKQSEGADVNAQDFAKYCILYGLDANKPTLR